MSLLADLLSTIWEQRYRSGDSDRRLEKLGIGDLADELIGSKGEISGRAIATHLLDRYADLEDADKQAFFTHMAQRMSVDPAAVRGALDAYSKDPTKRNYNALRDATEPDRQELIRRLNQVPGATGRLVAMRQDLYRLSKDNPALAEVDVDFLHLFRSWFNRGFLVLRPISWETPAHILEKIIAYEAVHAIDSWDDLRRRLQPSDRRCFAFFHPAMPDEPLIFVEVALTKGVPGSIQNVLAEDRTLLAADKADTAVFYSISNCQSGLAGISFCNSLIKQVVADLSVELPGLKTFVTLSPIPGLMKWLKEIGCDKEVENADRLKALGAHYLLSARRDDGSPRDPVARFHLGNGAMIHAVHAGADTSEKGMAQSGGAMVNYRYVLKDISANHERFATAREIVASQEVRSLNNGATKLIPKDG